MSKEDFNPKDVQRVGEIATDVLENMRAKNELLNQLKAEGKVLDEMTIITANYAVTLIHLARLVEGGFIEMESIPRFTNEGFDTTMDIIEAGWKLDKYDSLQVCSELFNEMDREEHAQIADLVLAIQEHGIKGMHELLDEKMKENEERGGETGAERRAS